MYIVRGCAAFDYEMNRIFKDNLNLNRKMILSSLNGLYVVLIHVSMSSFAISLNAMACEANSSLKFKHIHVCLPLVFLFVRSFVWFYEAAQVFEI